MYTNTLGLAWWVLFALNVGLTFFLLWRNLTLKEKYHDLEDQLHADYKRAEGHLLDEIEMAHDAQKKYMKLIKEHEAGFVPEGD